MTLLPGPVPTLLLQPEPSAQSQADGTRRGIWRSEARPLKGLRFLVLDTKREGAAGRAGSETRRCPNTLASRPGRVRGRGHGRRWPSLHAGCLEGGGSAGGQCTEARAPACTRPLLCSPAGGRQRGALQRHTPRWERNLAQATVCEDPPRHPCQLTDTPARDRAGQPSQLIPSSRRQSPPSSRAAPGPGGAC